MNEALAQALNDQMNYEFHSSVVYLAMAAYASSENVDGFANFFIVQAEEERFHAMKIYKFLNDRGLRATLTGMSDPQNHFDSIVHVFTEGYKHEKEVTKRLYHLSDIAMDHREHATIHFLKWFIDEQVEEEALFDGIVQKLKRIDKDSNAFFMLDAELANRTFTPPTA